MSYISRYMKINIKFFLRYSLLCYIRATKNVVVVKIEGWSMDVLILVLWDRRGFKAKWRIMEVR